MRRPSNEKKKIQKATQKRNTLTGSKLGNFLILVQTNAKTGIREPSARLFSTSTHLQTRNNQPFCEKYSITKWRMCSCNKLIHTYRPPTFNNLSISYGIEKKKKKRLQWAQVKGAQNYNGYFQFNTLECTQHSLTYSVLIWSTSTVIWKISSTMVMID